MRLLLELLEGPMRERDLRDRVGGQVPSTTTRHLDRLVQLGLVSQETQRGDRELEHPAKTEALLLAAADLSEEISTRQARADRDFIARLRAQGKGSRRSRKGD